MGFIGFTYNQKITKLIDRDLMPEFKTVDGGYDSDDLIFAALAQILRELRNQKTKEIRRDESEDTTARIDEG